MWMGLTATDGWMLGLWVQVPAAGVGIGYFDLFFFFFFWE